MTIQLAGMFKNSKLSDVYFDRINNPYKLIVENKKETEEALQKKKEIEEVFRKNKEIEEILPKKKNSLSGLKLDQKFFNAPRNQSLYGNQLSVPGKKNTSISFSPREFEHNRSASKSISRSPSPRVTLPNTANRNLRKKYLSNN